METKLWFYVYFVLLVFWVEFSDSIRWLSLQHSHLHWNLSSTNNHHPDRKVRQHISSPCTMARRRYGFFKIQAKLCRTSIDVMPHIQMAAVMAADTCRNAFEHRRWNCSSISTAPYFTPDLTRATREQAYVYAISSAALTFTVARACSSGALQQCTCASKPNTPSNGQFQWGGCGDNVKWGAQFARRFIDNVEKSMLEWKGGKGGKKEEPSIIEDLSREDVAAVNLHNSRVGRKVIISGLQTQCKCHGVSGSCNIKTCWRALPPMAEIGQKLIFKYDSALEVSGNLVKRSASQEAVFKKPKNKAVSTQTLIYLSKSPSYCTKDERLGSLGTVGRHCNLSSNDYGSCKNLCCGRSYTTVVEEKLERCKCKFYNCCYVKCKICRSMTQIYECL